MGKLARHAVVAQLIGAMREANSWCARTHVQKTLYSFQALFQPEPELVYPYLLYMHGMYSFELDEDLAQMVFYSALEREEAPPYGPRYATGPGAGILSAKLGARAKRWLPAIRFIASEIGPRNVRQLEALTTMMYVASDAREGLRDTGIDDQLARVRELKPHLSDEQVEFARAEYQRLL